MNCFPSKGHILFLVVHSDRVITQTKSEADVSESKIDIKVEPPFDEDGEINDKAVFNKTSRNAIVKNDYFDSDADDEYVHWHELAVQAIRRLVICFLRQFI